MKLSLIVIGAAASCLLLSGEAIAGPCAAQIDMLSKQLAMTGGAAGTGTPNPVSPSGSPTVPAVPDTASPPDPDANPMAMPGSASATAALQRAQELDRSNDPACMDQITKAQDSMTQP